MLYPMAVSFDNWLCNHGRFHPYYTRPGNRAIAVSGYRLPEGQYNSAGGESRPPLPFLSVPLAFDWMGLEWSSLYPLTGRSLAHVVSDPGVYKIIDADTATLLYIGQSFNVRKRLQQHLNRKWQCQYPVFSFAALSDDILLHHYLSWKMI